jgi:hypothetical protein
MIPPLLVQATLGDVTQIESFLFVSCMLPKLAKTSKGTFTCESNFTLGLCMFLKKQKSFVHMNGAKLMQNRPLKSDV